MNRKRMTEIFPWLLPIRKKQKAFCFYAHMRRDGALYSKEQRGGRLPYLIFETRCPMINGKTGFDLKYQENKVFNLKLASAKLNGLIIKPGEVFSFWQSIRHADKHTPYREGLAEINGRLTTEYGGGLCMLSNLLFWTLLHTELTIMERHGHREKDFPEPPSDALIGVDATVAEGWLDLKFKNDSDTEYQIEIAFDEEHIIGRVYAARDSARRYEVKNGSVRYVRRSGQTYELAQVMRRTIENGAVTAEEELYTNRCRIGYMLPEGTQIEEEA